MPKTPRTKIWNRETDSLLGTLTDKEIAKRVGRTPETVRTRRNKLGIVPSHHLQWRCKWGVTELGMLGKYSDAEIAAITGRSLREVIAMRTKTQL